MKTTLLRDLNNDNSYSEPNTGQYACPMLCNKLSLGHIFSNTIQDGAERETSMQQISYEQAWL
jgi:hypothetical protein